MAEGYEVPAAVIIASMRGPTVAAFVSVRVTCWPTIGARSVSMAMMNASSSACWVSLIENTCELRKVKSVSIEPS